MRILAAVFLALLILVVVWAAIAESNAQPELAGNVAANTTPVVIEGFTRAEGPKLLSFPSDMGPHLDYRTEWWYYTGNLDTADDRHFGYELTFFRGAILPPDQLPPRSSDWATNQVYMAHLALTDVDGGQFYAYQRYARGAAGLAGAQAEPYEVWLEDWSVTLTAPDTYALVAANEGIRIEFTLVDEKGPILHGDAGYSQKGPEAGNASYYYSQPRLATEGIIEVDGERFEVSGLSWKDHEYSTSVLSEGQVGWDWFSIQLSNGYDLMLYQIRQTDGGIAPLSSGTLIAPDGSTQHLDRENFSIEPTGSWTSPHSGGIYPMGWVVRIPSVDLEIDLQPYLEDQELNMTTIYWEGAVRVDGRFGSNQVTGHAYVELTGYAEPFDGDF